jgi:hypothetical protein
MNGATLRSVRIALKLLQIGIAATLAYHFVWYLPILVRI